MGGALALSLFLSCEKDKLRTVESDPLKEVPSLRAVPDSEALPHIMAGADAWEISHDQTLNNMAAVSLNLFLGKSKFNQWIINNAKQALNSAVSVSDFINYAETIATPEESLILQELKLQVKYADLNYPKDKLNPNAGYDIYAPAIFVPDVHNRNALKHPFVSGGVEMSDLLVGYEDYENHIIAYREPSTSQEIGHVEFFMDEEDLLLSDVPLFIFDNAEPALLNLPPQQYSNPTATAPPGGFSDHKYDHREYVIHTRHEKDSRSEMHITAVHYNLSNDPNYSGAGYVMKKNNGTYVADKRIRKIHKNDVGKEFSKWTRFVYDVWEPYSENPIIWNVYEQDWGKSDKLLGKVDVAIGKTLHLYGRTKYKHQWFLFNTYDNNYNMILDQNFIYWNWVKRHGQNSSPKNGEMVIWRVVA